MQQLKITKQNNDEQPVNAASYGQQVMGT